MQTSRVGEYYSVCQVLPAYNAKYTQIEHLINGQWMLWPHQVIPMLWPHQVIPILRMVVEDLYASDLVYVHNTAVGLVLSYCQQQDIPYVYYSAKGKIADTNIDLYYDCS